MTFLSDRCMVWSGNCKATLCTYVMPYRKRALLILDGNVFLYAAYSPFVIIAELWRPEVARSGFFSNFCVLLEKTTPYGKNFLNFVPNFYMATPINVVVFKCRKICPTGNRLNRALFAPQKKNISTPSQTVATAQIAPNFCQGCPPTFGSQCSKFHPKKVIAERVKAVLLAHRVFAIFARTSG